MTALAQPVPMDSARHRDQVVVELRMQGLTFDAIATRMGLDDRSTAYRAFRRGLARTPQEHVKEQRTLELERIDALWVPMFAKGLAGNHLAVDRCIALMERRAKLLGLDAPVRVRQEVITEAQLDAAIADMEARNAELEAQQAARAVITDIFGGESDTSG